MKKAGRDIPAAELEALGVLWRIEKGNVRDVMAGLEAQGRRLAYTTVLTLLTRLEKRGYLQKSRGQQAHVYRPRISREQVAAGRVGSLVPSPGGGEAVPFILKLVEAQKLSADDLRRLREHLSELEDEAERRGRS